MGMDSGRKEKLPIGRKAARRRSRRMLEEFRCATGKVEPRSRIMDDHYEMPDGIVES
jgi:hypothetical protein